LVQVGKRVVLVEGSLQGVAYTHWARMSNGDQDAYGAPPIPGRCEGLGAPAVVSPGTSAETRRFGVDSAKREAYANARLVAPFSSS